MNVGKVVGVFVTILLTIMLFGCFLSLEKVPAGYRGVRVNLYGTERGVDYEVLGVGRYFINPFTQELYLFPVFQQTKEWALNKDMEGWFAYQSVDGTKLSVDASISYTVDEEKVGFLFETYRKSIEEITDLYLHNIIRDQINNYASDKNTEFLYGIGKSQMREAITKEVRDKMSPIGIKLDYFALTSDVKLPMEIRRAIDAKVQATQDAIKKETEVQAAKAEAEKAVAAAEGEARSKKALADANAYSIIKEAEAQKKANELLASSLTKELIDYNVAVKWDGKLPSVTGGNTPLIKLP